MRETLFNLVAGRVDGAEVLDLYAGSGILGLEALARGAAFATFVERDRKAQAAIRENIRRCGFEERSKLIGGNIPSVLRKGGRFPSGVGLIFADPPYADPVFEKLLETVREQELLGGDGLLVFEAAARSSLDSPEGWRLIQRREVGDTALLLLELETVES